MSDQNEPVCPRVFLDATVLYAASLGGGVKKLWSLDSVQLVTSEYAAQEVWTNLKYEDEPETCRLRLLYLLEPPLEFVPWEQTDLPLFCPWKLKDANDIPILMGALGSNCNYLLTADTSCFGEYLGETVDGLTVLRPGKFIGLHGG